MKKAKKAKLFLAPDHRLNVDASLIVQKHFELVDDVYASNVFVSFLCPRIHRGDYLHRIPSINIHPAPPAYPGRGSASRALFDGATEYGVTAHGMVEAIDAGPIWGVTRFRITPADTCETLFARAERLGLDLLDRLLRDFALTGAFHETAERWDGPAWTRKRFQKWMETTPEGPVESLIRACRHSRFPGPWLLAGGHRWRLDESPPG